MVENRSSYLVVLRSSGDGDVDDARRALESAGVELDQSFPAIPLTSEQPVIILRGVASRAAVEKAKAVANVEFFPDLKVGPS